MSSSVFHVACLPFPTFQGTQAAIKMMLETSRAQGIDARLIAYAQGVTQEHDSTIVQRLKDFPRVRSLRSGPSLGKLALDAQMVFALREQAKKSAPRCWIAHHVESAFATSLAGVAPWIYFAHTSLEEELETYFPNSLRNTCAALGKRIDRYCVTKAHAVAAISPLLARTLSDRYRREVHYVPTPWPLPAERWSSVRQAHARAELGLALDADVLLYAGNLDAYQGLGVLLQACAKAQFERPSLRLLISTESEHTSFLRMAQSCGVADRVLFSSLKSEADRDAVHSAADVALVPRATSGGLPIKLLDALARGTPVITSEVGCAGLDLKDRVTIAANHDANDLARTIVQGCKNKITARTRALDQLNYIEEQHDSRSFLQALEGVIAASSDRSNKMQKNQT